MVSKAAAGRKALGGQAKEEDGTDDTIKTDGEAVFEEKVHLILSKKVVIDNCWPAIYWRNWIIVKKLSEQYALKLKQSSVTEASDFNFQPSWRGAEAVEASDTHEIGPLPRGSFMEIV